MPEEILDQLFGLPGVKLEVVPLAPVHAVLNKDLSSPSLMRLMIARSSENFCRLLWGDWWEKSAVYRVNRKGARTVPCWPPRQMCPTHSPESSHTVASWRNSRGSRMHVVGPPSSAPACPQICVLYGVESTGEIKEHDPHIASRLFQVRQ